MITDRFPVSSDPDDIRAALGEVERAGTYLGLTPEQNNTLRLLAEESILLAEEVLDKAPGLLWLEREGAEYNLHVQVRTAISPEAREEFLAVAKSGRNTPPKGFRARMSAFFSEIFGAGISSGEYIPAYFEGMAYGMIGAPYVPYPAADVAWSLAAWRENASKEEPEDPLLLDLEKSILERLADDVLVTLTGDSAELIVKKTFA